MPDKAVTKEVRVFLRDLRAFVKACGSQEEASRQLEVSNASVSFWLADKRTPSKMARRVLSPLLKKRN